MRPPYRVQNGRKDTARKAAADTLAKGLADQEFWDGEGTVRLLTWLHVAVVGGFLAIMLGVTVRALADGSPHASVLGWTGIALGTATIALAVGYVCLDALDTPSMGTPDAQPAIGAFAEKLRGFMVYLLVPAGAGLVCSGWFAWLQPGTPSVRAADLPGMAGVTGWTALAIAVAVGIALISVLLGLRGSGGTMFGGSWVTLMLGFGSLNVLLLGAAIWVAHLVGPVTSDAAQALSAKPGQIYLSHVITSGVPLLVWAAVLAAVVFGVVEAVRWLRTDKLPDEMAGEYEKQAAEFRTRLSETPRNVWYWSGLPPFPPTGDTTKDQGAGGKWQRQIARVQFLGRAPHDAIWLLWLIIVGQLVMAVCVWQLNLQPPVLIRNVGIALAGLVLPALAAFLYAAWSDPTKRRTIGVLWDVGTFWPRSYHPLCPPCYAERAVPDLQRRMWWLHDNDGRVMLVAHSQGTVLAVAALVQTACRPEGDHPALITFGSPVCKLYGWAFPAWFDHALLEPLAPGQAARVNDWRNFFYPTDPIGGSVAPELSAVGGDPVDTEFADPADRYYVYGQPPPASTGHSGYWADRRVWDVINGVAAGLPGGPDDISPERVQEIVHGPEGTVSLPGDWDRGGETVEVIAGLKRPGPSMVMMGEACSCHSPAPFGEVPVDGANAPVGVEHVGPGPPEVVDQGQVGLGAT